MLRGVTGEVERLDAPWAERVPELVRLKHERMKESALAFLRASAPIFFVRLREALAPDEALARWFATGEHPRLVWCAGDVHLENFGAYRTNDGLLRFGLNDFDDALVAPLEIDVLRLAASTLVAARGKDEDGPTAVTLARRLLMRYSEHLDDGTPDPAGRELGSYVANLLDTATDASRADFIEKRAPMKKGKRAFVASERYRPLEGSERERVLAAVAKATEPLAPTEKQGFYEPIDVAARVAGLGSLGCGRYAVLVAGGNKGNALLELKEAKPPSLERHGCPRKPGNEAARVVEGLFALRGEKPPHTGSVDFEGRAYYLRRLYHREMRVYLDPASPKDLEAIVDAEALALARSHARSRRTLGLGPIEKPSAALQAEWLGLAAWLAGAVEADYLAFVAGC